MAHVKSITDDSFDKEIKESSIPVLVDFFASWCSPCRMMSPVLDDTAKEYSGRLQIAKINVDENPGIASRYSVMSLPTMILFNKGKPVGKIVGYVPKAQLKKALDSAIG